jgi:hypothetical protein
VIMKRFLTASLAAVLVSVSIATPAQAAYSDCSAYPGTICFHQYTNYTGQVWRQYPWEINGCRSLVPDNFNDKASTAFNTTPHSYSVRVWQHSNCTGDSFTLNSNSVYNFAGNGWDNRISAVEVIAAFN